MTRAYEGFKVPETPQVGSQPIIDPEAGCLNHCILALNDLGEREAQRRVIRTLQERFPELKASPVKEASDAAYREFQKLKEVSARTGHRLLCSCVECGQTKNSLTGA